MNPITCTVAEDGQSAFVADLPPLDAARVEALIDDLMACRAAMLPRRTATMFPGTRITLGSGWHVQRDGAEVLLAVGHPAGWCGVRVDEASEKRLRQALLAPAARRPEASSRPWATRATAKQGSAGNSGGSGCRHPQPARGSGCPSGSRRTRY